MKKFMCFVIMIVLLLSGTSGAIAKTTEMCIRDSGGSGKRYWPD